MTIITTYIYIIIWLNGHTATIAHGRIPYIIRLSDLTSE